MPILRASNLPLTEWKETTSLVQTAASGAGTITVKNTAQFSVGQYILIGDFGNEGSEIIRIHTSTAPVATTGVITLAANLVKSHSIDDSVTQIDFNQVEFSRSTTEGGAKSVLATVDVEADDLYTSYNDTANNTGFGFVRYKNQALTTYSGYSGAIPYTGTPLNAVGRMKEAALGITHEKIGGANVLITDRFLLAELNNWQKEVASARNWEFELDTATVTMADGVETYSLPDSPGPLKHKDTNQSIVQARFEDQARPLDYVDKREMDTLQESGSTGVPWSYTIYNDILTVFPVPTSDEDGDTVTLNYYIELPELTDDQSTTRIPFYHLAQFYLAWKIEELKGNQNRADRHRQTWENRLRREMNRSHTGQYFRLVPAIKHIRTGA